MRAVFANPPSDEKVVKKEIRHLSKRLGVENPGIVLWSRGDGLYNYEERTLYIPEWDWVTTYDPELMPEKYWCLVMHEFSHYLDDQWNNKMGHGATFYSILTGLVMANGLPLEVFQQEENWYKPIGLRNGKHMAGWRLLESHKK